MSEPHPRARLQISNRRVDAKTSLLDPGQQPESTLAKGAASPPQVGSAEHKQQPVHPAGVGNTGGGGHPSHGQRSQACTLLALPPHPVPAGSCARSAPCLHWHRPCGVPGQLCLQKLVWPRLWGIPILEEQNRQELLLPLGHQAPVPHVTSTQQLYEQATKLLEGSAKICHPYPLLMFCKWTLIFITCIQASPVVQQIW